MSVGRSSIREREWECVPLGAEPDDANAAEITAEASLIWRTRRGDHTPTIRQSWLEFMTRASNGPPAFQGARIVCFGRCRNRRPRALMGNIQTVSLASGAQKSSYFQGMVSTRSRVRTSGMYCATPAMPESTSGVSPILTGLQSGKSSGRCSPSQQASRPARQRSIPQRYPSTETLRPPSIMKTLTFGNGVCDHDGSCLPYSHPCRTSAPRSRTKIRPACNTKGIHRAIRRRVRHTSLPPG